MAIEHHRNRVREFCERKLTGALNIWTPAEPGNFVPEPVELDKFALDKLK